MFSACRIVCFIKKIGNKISMRNKMIRNFFPNHQFRIDTFHSQIATRTKNGPKSSIWEQYVPFTDGNSEQNGAKCPIVNKLFHLQMGTWNEPVENLVLNDQFGNKVFHSQIGIWNKTVLNDQFGNSVFHLQIGTQNKTVLNDQFGNSVFHLQIGTQNKTPNLPIWEQFVPFTDRNSEQNSPNLPIWEQFVPLTDRTQNKTVLNAPLLHRVNVLFLPCKKSWSSHSQQEHKNEE